MNCFLFSLFIVVFCSALLIDGQRLNGYDFGQHYSRIRIFDYETYADIKLLKFNINGPSRMANWSLTFAPEGKCDDPSISIDFYLQYGAYPLATPENESFPENYIKTRHDLLAFRFNQTSTTPVVHLNNPLIGTWFAMTYVNRPSNHLKSKIITTNQNGCNYYLSSWLDYQIDPIHSVFVLNEPLEIVFSREKSSIFISHYTTTGNVRLTLQSSWPTVCDVMIYARINGLPNSLLFDYKTVCRNEICLLEIEQFSALLWIYFYVQVNNSTCLNNSQSAKFLLRPTECQSNLNEFCIQSFPTRRIMFNYYYDFLYVPIYSTRSSSGSTSSITFNSFDFSLYSFEFIVDDRNLGGTLHFDLESRILPLIPSNVNVSILGCLSKSRPRTFDRCEFDYRMIVEKNSMTIRSFPYPEMALWYLTLQYNCNGSIDECRNTSLSLMFQISSSQCTKQQCGSYGICRIMTSQQNVFSTCSCFAGYRGYGCTDSTYSYVSKSLTSVLFLTLSNLMFLPAIVLAIHRRLYIEGLIYFFNMFFSTFYHACDQEINKFCIFKYDGLQLSDFIGSYASFVVTIITMAIIPSSIKAFLFVLGLLTCIVINSRDRFDHIQFIMLISASFTFTIVTWAFVSIKRRRLHPSYKRLILVTPGFLLALTGLILFAFCETEDNYWYIHSLWHIFIASSILFFLPHKKSLRKEISRQQTDTTAVSLPVDTEPIAMPIDNTSLSSSNTDESKKSTDNLLN